jgi:peptide/nickel transport system permease protein
MAATTTAVEELELRARRPVPWAVARGMLRFAYRKPLGAFGAVVAVVLIVVAVLAPQVATHDPNLMAPAESTIGPSADHLMGTDNMGRDIFSRIVYGARVSIQIATLAIVISITVGTAVGLVSGYLGGKADITIQRFVDTGMAFPTLVLALILVGFFGASIRLLIIALGFVFSPAMSRLVRGSVLSAKQNVYVDAARGLGASDIRIMVRHILPNVMAPIIVVGTAQLGTVILAEASLSFLGFGPPPPNATWGSMLAGESRIYMTVAWWMAVFPGLAITLAVLGFNLLGDALRDVWDPRLRGT